MQSSEGELRRAAVIAHPGRINAEQLRVELHRAERAYGWAPTLWFETALDEPADQLTHRALAEGAQRIITAGGDGTVRAAAEALIDTGVPLGIIPAGTGNLLARNLGIDLMQLRTQLETALTSEPHPIDVARASFERPGGTRGSAVFTVLGGVGVDAGMIANTDPDLKRRIGWLAYIGGIARSVIGEANFHAQVKIDDHHFFATRAHSLMIGNCGQLPGGMRLLPDAAIDDGLLDLVVMRPSGLFGWLQIWWNLMIQSGLLRHSEFGRSLLAHGRQRVRALRYLRGRRIDFRIDGPPRHFQVDGEAIDEIVAAHIEVLPGCLSVCAPERSSTLASKLQEFGQEVAAKLDEARLNALAAHDQRQLTAGEDS